MKYSIFQRLINKRRFFVSINLSLEEQAREILKFQPHFIFGMTSSLDVLANWMIENNICYKNVKFVLTSGETTDFDLLSDKFRKVFGHPGLDIYGTNECGMIGFQCPYCNLRYFDDDSYVVEILDENDDPVKPGEKGRAVITVLDQFASPMIRYDIGDYITIPRKEVNCKIKFTHFISIDGREDDRIILEDDRIIHVQHLLAVSNSIEAIKQIQLFQERNGRIRIIYVCKFDVDNQEIEKDILEKLNPKHKTEVSFEKRKFIPLEPNGKFKMVKREVADTT